MKTFALACFAGAASAQWGTTGHVGNAFAGGSWTDHSHQDHIYGYDSVKSYSKLRDTTTTEYTNNQSRLTAVKTEIATANTARKDYIKLILDRKRQRLQEIHNRNLREASAPFEYQIRLLAKESDDVIVAMTEATNDAADSFRDMIDRLEQLLDDKLSIFTRELNHVERALDRAYIDQKDSCDVLRSMRVQFTKNVACLANTLTVGDASISFTNDDTEWRIYEGMFDDFHYDIGHGKGLGLGSVDAASLTTGFRNGNLAAGAIGDIDTSFGAPTRTTELPRTVQRGGRF